MGLGGGSVPGPGCPAAQTELGLRPRLPPRPGWEPPAPLSGSLCLLTEDEQREKSVSHQTVQQLVLEKEQALSDLNSVEKSLADLFRRYEKMKEVLEGFRKVCSHRAEQDAGPGFGDVGADWERLQGPGLGGPGFSRHQGVLGAPSTWGVSSVGATSVLCPVRMRRC